MTTEPDEPTDEPLDEPTDEPTLTVDELAAKAGVTVRTVRFYGTKGLLPPPVIGARRVGHYGPEHLARLALIEELQNQGMTLAAIERYLRQLPPDLTARDLAVHRAVVSSWALESTRNLSREELARQAGRPLSDRDLDRLTAMDILTPAGDGYRVDVSLLRLGVELLDVPLSHEAIVTARTVMLDHSRAAAQELTDLLRGEVAERATADVRSLSAHMEPLVVQALLTAFQRSLREEVSKWLGPGRPESSGDTAPGSTPPA